MGTKQWTSITEFREFYDRRKSLIFGMRIMRLHGFLQQREISAKIYTKVSIAERGLI